MHFSELGQADGVPAQVCALLHVLLVLVEPEQVVGEHVALRAGE